MLQSFPPSILFSLSLLLSFDDLSNVSLSCKRLNVIFLKISASPNFWKRRFKSSFGFPIPSDVDPRAFFQKFSKGVFGYGYNQSHEVDDSDTRNIYNPRPVFPNLKIRNVWCRDYCTLILDTNGKVHLRGRNYFNSIDHTYRITFAIHNTYCDVFSSHNHALFLQNSEGEIFLLGDCANVVNPVQFPKLLNFSTKIKKVACGSYHTLFLDERQNVWGFGDNDLGCLGTGNTKNISSPQIIHTQVFDVVCGNLHSFISKLDENCKLQWFSFGYNELAQCGTGDQNNIFSPKVVQFSENLNIVSVAAGEFHSLFLSDDGTVFACGDNSFGQCGQAQDVVNVICPTQIGIFKALKIFAYDHRSAFIDTEGNFYTFGMQSRVVTTLYNPGDFFLPQILPGFKVRDVSFSSQHTVFFGAEW